MAFPAGCYPKSQKPLSVPFVGPLDAYATGLGGAYSVARRLLTSYTGTLIRVRRDSDGTEADIGFDADGLLDEVGLLTFVGAGSGYLVKLYDQSGAGYDLVQATASDQMTVAASGVVVTSGGFPAVNNPSDKWFATAGPVAWRHWFMFHDTGAAITDGNYLFDARPDLAGGYLFDDILEGPNWTSLRKNGVATTLNGAGLFDANPHLITVLGSDSTVSVGYFLRFNSVNLANRTGKIREIVTYSVPLSDTTRDAVEAALMP